MKKIILGLILIGLLLPLAGLAQSSLSVNKILINVRNILFGILSIVSGIFIVIGGYLIVTAQGDAEKFRKGREAVIYALVGFLLAGMSIALMRILGSILGL